MSSNPSIHAFEVNRMVLRKQVAYPMFSTANRTHSLADDPGAPHAEANLDLLRELSQQVPGLIFQFRRDPDGRSSVPYASDAVQDIYELTPQQVKADVRTVLARVHPQDVAAMERSVTESAENLTVWQYEYRVVLPGKGLRWLEGVAKPQRLPSGSIIWHGFIQDITDRKAIKAQLQEATDQAQAANRAKDQFLANMTHELRTPIHGVQGMLQLLQRTPLSEAQSMHVSCAIASAREMQGIVDNLLNCRQSPPTAPQLQAQACDLSLLAASVRTDLALDWQAKGLEFQTVVDRDIPRYLLADPTLVRQVLQNLCANAIKFTSRGEVTLAIELVGRRDHAVLLEFSVQDTGMGIASQDQRRIFEAFSQVDVSATRRHSGVGLGLTRSQQVVTLMGGEIQVDSRVGEGSRFHFQIALPLLESAPMAPPVEPAPLTLSSKPLEGLRILLVEDNKTNQLLARLLLIGDGAIVTVADHGEQAVQAVAQADPPFDLVLMDLQMPVMDGFEATRAIRANVGSQTLPIVALTANTLDADVVACKEAGMTDHVGKPFDYDELVQVLLKHTRGTASEAAVNTTTPDSTEAIDCAAALKRLGGSRALYLEAIQGFTQDMSTFPDALQPGGRASEGPQAARALHTLKGLANTVGANKLARHAADLEVQILQGLSPNNRPDAVQPLLASLSSTLAALSVVAQRLSTEITTTSSLSAAQPPQIVAETLHSDLQALHAFLTRDDMESLKVYARIRLKCHTQPHPGCDADFDALDAAMSHLDFVSAATLCETLLQEFA